MKNPFSYNLFSKFFIFLFILSLFPFLILCLYTYPASDDYSYGTALFKNSFFGALKSEYLNWGSRYTAASILFTSPIHFKWYSGYKIIAFSMIICFIIAQFYMFFNITQNKKLTLLLTAFFTFSYLFIIPDITAAFYWLAGSATYHLPNILSLLFIGILFKLNSYNSNIYKFLLFVLLFLIIGCNEVSMIYIDILIFILLLYSYLTEKKTNSLYLSLFIWAGILTLFILTAPGNHARSENIENKLSLLSIFINSFRKSVVILIRYGVVIFIINFLIFYNISNQLSRLNLKFLNQPFYFYIILFILILFLGSFPSLWSMGIYPPLRTVNVIVFVTLFFSMIFNYKIVTSPKILRLHLSQTFLIFTLLFLILSYTFAERKLAISELTNNLYYAYDDILSCKAVKYKQEVENRYFEIQNSKKDTVYLEPLHSIPSIIVNRDLDDNPGHFYNRGMARLFNKKAIIKRK